MAKISDSIQLNFATYICNKIYPKHPDVYKISVGHKNVIAICYMLLIKFARKNGLLFILTEQAIITVCFKKM